MKSSNVMTALVDIFISPSKAFNGLKEAKGWSFVAFILLAGILAASMFAFYNKADPQYLIDQQVAVASVDATIAEQGRYGFVWYKEQSASYVQQITASAEL